ncbi:16S rRNA (cytosine967-C5)-methyltransferase [Geosporobacter subterraneus DSM 17957]|uniref:16S rRNA (cytosine(967)-C(5))-methyltransferase n=1 Tax=Geosporobacter subterraneus DSM 17957 TaxID=1121919 RepID=A0A1M6P2J7_9FIRM|nr:16S rRNA (cytosine(967)-C(5))-methyltransferase RsmB [Geosporobacter subterraneus]SHK02156.1 16S rRNA (cytosine967-C5)-methyltransferase [Geosporobacter subterraneus DSM 17957]
METVNARRIALDVLVDIEKNNAFSNIALQRAMKNREIEDRDRRFVTELVYGVIENKIYLDYIINRLSKVKHSKIKVEVLNLLRMALYQIIFLDRIPSAAAVNESVKIVKKIEFGAAGYVNGLLRNFLRRREELKLDRQNMDVSEYLSIRYSHPKWLVEKWLKDFGEDFTEGLLGGNNERPSLTVRVNTLRTNKRDLIKILSAQGLEITEGKYSPEALYISNATNIEKLKAFQEGLFQIQDESSMLVAHVVNPEPGDFVMDLCAAPGGKTTHMAQLMKNQGRIIAWDIYDHKIKLIRDTARRLGISIIDTQCNDARELKQEYLGKADRVLVDAPCSGLGIIRKKPEIKYNKNLEDISKIVSIQVDILKNGARYVKKSGFLVYSTCTIEKKENIGVMEQFLKENEDFELVNINENLPAALRSDSKHLQLYPHIHGIDGFFICKFRRVR